jgi:hypothetical protein
MIRGRKTNWICHILRGNCHIKDIIERRREGKEDEEEDVSSYCITLRKQKILEIERSGSRSHCVENSLWKRLWTSRKIDCGMIVMTVCLCVSNIRS